jgi:hypothetical protein
MASFKSEKVFGFAIILQLVDEYRIRIIKNNFTSMDTIFKLSNSYDNPIEILNFFNEDKCENIVNIFEFYDTLSDLKSKIYINKKITHISAFKRYTWKELSVIAI